MSRERRQLVKKFFEEPGPTYPKISIDRDDNYLIATTYVRAKSSDGTWYKVKFVAKSHHNKAEQDRSSSALLRAYEVYNKIGFEIENARSISSLTDYVDCLLRDGSDRVVNTVNQASEKTRLSLINVGPLIFFSNKEGSDKYDKFFRYLNGEYDGQ